MPLGVQGWAKGITLGKCSSKCGTTLVRGFSAWLKINRSNLYLGALREQHRCEFSGTQHTFLFFSFNSSETYRACDLCCIHSRMLTQQADHQLFLVTKFCCSTVDVYHSWALTHTQQKKEKFDKEILQLQYFDKQQQHGLLS